MSHFNVCIFIKRDGSSYEQAEQRVDDILANFDINKEMSPYKYYVKADNIQQIARFYEVDPTDLSALAEKLERWNGDRGGVDENGLYGISTRNPDGHIDAWSIFPKVNPEDRRHLLFGGEKCCAAIVTPDGKWNMGPWVYYSPSPEQEKELEAWSRKLATLLDEHKEDFVFFAACHI